jgi:hypothetical protein
MRQTYFLQKTAHFGQISVSFCDTATRNYNAVRFLAFFSLHNTQAQVLEHITDFTVDQ